MSKIEVNTIEPQCGTTVTVGKCTSTVAVPGNVIKSNAVQASDGGNIVSQSGTDITLGASGDTINLASGASQSGFGRTGTVDWITTPKVTGDSPVTGVTGKGYFLNTTAGTITLNLPAGSAGDIISMADYAATWQTYNVTVAPNGSEKIGSVNANVTLSTQGQSVTLVYVDSTQGWINTMDSTSNVRGATPFIVATGGTPSTCGDYKIHTFTGPGCFTVTTAPTVPNNEASYLVVAGGGGGGNDQAGGAGAGGYREGKDPADPVAPSASPLAAACSSITLTASTTYPIVVGGGGSAATSGPGSGGSSGSVSSALGISSAGGGQGQSATETAGPQNDGGSGAGGKEYVTGTPHAGHSGNTPPTNPPQGTDGSPGIERTRGGAGGGATTAGPAMPNLYDGGTGGGTLINPSPSYGTPGPSAPLRYYGGGGAGTTANNPGLGTGGSGGGGNSVTYPGDPSTLTAGTVNTGGGGAAGNGYVAPVGSAGGSGIVIIRYKFQ